MTNAELQKFVIRKLGITKESFYGDGSQDCGVAFDYQGKVYLVMPDITVHQCIPGGTHVANDYAEQLEKLLRGEQWDGTGLPPVGTECEVMDKDHDHIWHRCKILAHIVRKGLPCAVFESEPSVSCCSDRYFRPLRTERDKAIEQIRKVGSSLPAAVPFAIEEAAAIYDAIVAGKIDGLGKVG